MPTPDLIRAAAAEGIISLEQADRLAAFAAAFGRDTVEDEPSAVEDTEAPRFVRGFHDVLITIGVVLGLGGFTALMQGVAGATFLAAFASAAVAWALSEVLVRRMRLALPAIALSIAFTIAAGIVVAPFVSAPGEGITGEGWRGAAMFLSAGIAAGAYFLRFRVPLSLALHIGALAAAIIAGYTAFAGPGNFGLIGDGLVLSLAIAIFAIALYFDVSDPQRQTRRADYAFWLHLIAAPALLGSVMNILVGFRSVFQLNGSLQTADAAIVFGVMVIMSLLAVMIDRRAFLVAGLSYLGAAIFSVADVIAGGGDLTGPVTVMLLGAVILLLALGWQRVRAVVIAPLPKAWKKRLPPIRRAASHPAGALSQPRMEPQ